MKNRMQSKSDDRMGISGVKDSDSHFTDPITGGKEGDGRCPRRRKDIDRPSGGKWHVI